MRRRAFPRTSLQRARPPRPAGVSRRKKGPLAGDLPAGTHELSLCGTVKNSQDCSPHDSPSKAFQDCVRVLSVPEQALTWKRQGTGLECAGSAAAALMPLRSLGPAPACTGDHTPRTPHLPRILTQLPLHILFPFSNSGDSLSFLGSVFGLGLKKNFLVLPHLSLPFLTPRAVPAAQQRR